MGAMNHAAILITTCGEITMSAFAELAEPDRLSDSLWNIRRLIDSSHPHGINLPRPDGLIGWIDGRAFTRKRDANVVASLLFQELLSAPLAVVRGPLLITGGTRACPRELTAEQARSALTRFHIALNAESTEGRKRH